MTVFVDDMKNRYGRMLMCHMGAETVDELHAMADRIGVDRRHFQGDHYDICQKMRRLAIAAGAVEITRRQMVRLVRHGDIPTTYEGPRHGWTCFHCGQTFHTTTQARGHFGVVPSYTPACLIVRDKGLVYALREVEEERDELQVRVAALRCGVDEAEAVARFRATRGKVTQ